MKKIAMTSGLAFLFAYPLLSPSVAGPAPSAPPFDEPLPAWDRQIEDGRFEVLEDFDDEAVLDRETGLVWERIGGDTSGDGDVDITVDGKTWMNSAFHCALKNVGGRKGWRLPAVHELLSLIDPQVPGSPKLPDDHPFHVPATGTFWSTTTKFDNHASAWVTDLYGNALFRSKGANGLVWCVRGPVSGPVF